jgi:lysophospholipase L1-like esterase
MARPRNLVVLAFVGDSITAGQFVAPPARWVDIVPEALTRRYLETPLNLLHFAEGVSGETTRQGLERFPASVQARQPDIVTIQFGLNDGNCWATDCGLPRVSEAAYRANLMEMIERCRAFEAQHVILSNNHPTLRHKVLLSGRSLEEQRIRYNRILAEVAAEAGATFCDIDAAFRDLQADDLERQLLPYPDGLHLSPEGHMRYAAAIEPALVAAVEDVWRNRGGS